MSSRINRQVMYLFWSQKSLCGPDIHPPLRNIFNRQCPHILYWTGVCKQVVKWSQQCIQTHKGQNIDEFQPSKASTNLESCHYPQVDTQFLSSSKKYPDFYHFIGMVDVPWKSEWESFFIIIIPFIVCCRVYSCHCSTIMKLCRAAVNCTSTVVVPLGTQRG